MLKNYGHRSEHIYFSFCLKAFVGHTDHVTCVAVSVTNKSLVISGSRDANLIVWDMITGADLFTLTGHLGYVTCVKLSGDGSVAVSGMLFHILYFLPSRLIRNTSISSIGIILFIYLFLFSRCFFM